MPKVTLQQLRDHGACPGQVELFRETFGDSAEITMDACLTVAQLFNFDWAGCHLLAPGFRADYQRITAPARAEFIRLLASSDCRADYRRILASTFAELYITQDGHHGR